MNTLTLDATKAVPRHPLNFTTWPPRTAALVAGWSFALMAVLGGFSNFGAIVPLIAKGDATQTARNIGDSPILFFSGVVGFLLIAILDVLVAGAMYALFKPVNRRISAIAGWMRAAYSVLLVAAVSQLVIGYTLLDNPEKALPVLESFNTIWVIVQGLFGASLLVIGYLAYRANFIASIFGVLLVVTGAGYLADAICMAFVPGFTAVFAQYLFGGEVVLIFWLFIRGRRLPSN